MGISCRAYARADRIASSSVANPHRDTYRCRYTDVSSDRVTTVGIGSPLPNERPCVRPALTDCIGGHALWEHSLPRQHIELSIGIVPATAFAVGTGRSDIAIPDVLPDPTLEDGISDSVPHHTDLHPRIWEFPLRHQVRDGIPTATDIDIDDFYLVVCHSLLRFSLDTSSIPVNVCHEAGDHTGIVFNSTGPSERMQYPWGNPNPSVRM